MTLSVKDVTDNKLLYSVVENEKNKRRIKSLDDISKLADEMLFNVITVLVFIGLFILYKPIKQLFNIDETVSFVLSIITSLISLSFCVGLLLNVLSVIKICKSVSHDNLNKEIISESSKIKVIIDLKNFIGDSKYIDFISIINGVVELRNNDSYFKVPIDYINFTEDNIKSPFIKITNDTIDMVLKKVN